MLKSKGILYVLCGVPGCGKSTLAEEIGRCMESKLVSRDAIRFSILKEDDEYFANENLVFKRYMKLINEGLSKDFSVIADATHITPTNRRKLLSNLTFEPLKIVCFYFNLPLEVCLKRNNQREGKARVPEFVIKQMYDRFKIPEYSEGFDLIYEVKDDKLIIQNEV